VIVYNLDVNGTIGGPADTPLVVDADAPLTATIAFQRLLSIARWRPEVRKPNSRIEHIEFALSHLGKTAPSRWASAPSKEMLGRPVSESLDHQSL
jgi:hypothetical protein